MASCTTGFGQEACLNLDGAMDFCFAFSTSSYGWAGDGLEVLSLVLKRSPPNLSRRSVGKFCSWSYWCHFFTVIWEPALRVGW